MSYKYRYIKISGEPKRYFCIQQSLFTLIWLLFLKKNTLAHAAFGSGVRKWSLSNLQCGIWNKYCFVRLNLSKVKSFLLYKYHLRKMEMFIEFPFYGQTCVLVNKGNKIFDFRRGIAIKIYRNNIDIASIRVELERLKIGNLFGFAPSIKRWNINERWYEEDYICGSLDYSRKPWDSSAMQIKFDQDIIPCLESLVLHRTPIQKILAEYLRELEDSLVGANLRREVLAVNKSEKILDFVKSMVKRVQSEGELPIFQVLTHGDFCPANILNTMHGVKILDWESAENRSVLFDFYSYFFFRAAHQGLPVHELALEIGQALPAFISRLFLKMPALCKNIRLFEKTYRHLYYIERVCMLVDRERTDTKLDIMKIMIGYIDVFNQYEEIMLR